MEVAFPSFFGGRPPLLSAPRHSPRDSPESWPGRSGAIRAEAGVFRASVLAVLGSAVAVFSILAAVRRSGSPSSEFLPALLAAAIALSGGSAILVLVVVPARMDAASLAALRTGALAAASFAAALLGRFGRAPEAGWLVYPVLGLGGIKLLLETCLGAGPHPVRRFRDLRGGAPRRASDCPVRREGRRSRRVMSAVRRLGLTGDQALGRADGDRSPVRKGTGFRDRGSSRAPRGRFSPDGRERAACTSGSASARA